MLKDESTKVKLRTFIKTANEGRCTTNSWLLIKILHGAYSCMVRSHNIPAMETPALLNNKACIYHLLQHLASMSVCQGNQDDKFHKLIPSQKGILYEQRK